MVNPNLGGYNDDSRSPFGLLNVRRSRGVLKIPLAYRTLPLHVIVSHASMYTHMCSCTRLVTIAICGPSGKRVYAGPATDYALIARPTVRSRSPQCDPIANQTNLQVISRSFSDDMMLEEGPAATGGNADPSMQPTDMPMVADQTSPPRKQLRQDSGGSGQDLSAIHARGETFCPVS